MTQVDRDLYYIKAYEYNQFQVNISKKVLDRRTDRQTDRQTDRPHSLNR